MALLVETSSSYGRMLLAGISRWIRIRRQWHVYTQQRDLFNGAPDWLRDLRCDGVISRVTTPDIAADLATRGIPLVELTDRVEMQIHAHFRSDDRQIGALAAGHLLERGFERFGFCGFEGEGWSNRRCDGFTAVIEAAGKQCQIYQTPWTGPDALPWRQEEQRIAGWLKGLSPPVGIMACNDVRGQQILDVCSGVPLAVPEEVAVIGVDNDELSCLICQPPLSSIIPNAEEIGFQAASRLDRMIQGLPKLDQKIAIPPLGIVTRQSTDVQAISNPNIAATLNFIRQNACSGISVDEVVTASTLSRSTLERQFRKLIGRTPQQEIRMVQINRVRELLTSTDLPPKEIATICGFESVEYMYVVFKRITRVTPGAYRMQAQETRS